MKLELYIGSVLFGTEILKLPDITGMGDARKVYEIREKAFALAVKKLKDRNSAMIAKNDFEIFLIIESKVGEIEVSDADLGIKMKKRDLRKAG